MRCVGRICCQAAVWWYVPQSAALPGASVLHDAHQLGSVMQALRGKQVIRFRGPCPESFPPPSTDMQSFHRPLRLISIGEPQMDVFQGRNQPWREEPVQICRWLIAAHSCRHVPGRTERVHHQMLVRIPAELLSQGQNASVLVSVDLVQRLVDQLPRINRSRLVHDRPFNLMRFVLWMKANLCAEGYKATVRRAQRNKRPEVFTRSKVLHAIRSPVVLASVIACPLQDFCLDAVTGLFARAS